MIFSKRTIRTTSIPKIRKIHSGVWKLKANNLQNCQFWPKNCQILATHGQILAISEFFRHIHYDFLKEDHKGSFHTKIYENLYRCLEDIGQKHSKMAILAKNGQILIIFGHFVGQKIVRPKKFLETIEVVWRPNFMQKIRKKYQTVKAVGPELTYARTYIRKRMNL